MPRLSRKQRTPEAPSIEEHNRVLRLAEARALKLEDRLVAILQPILNRAGDEAASAFSRMATDHLGAAGQPGVKSTSTMVCLKPTPEEAGRIAKDGALDASTLHVTLAYLGDVEGDLEPVVAAIRAAAAVTAPLRGVVGGVGMFAPGPDGAPVIALPDVPGLVELRVRVTEALVEAGIDYSRDHGFCAHMTLDYANVEGGDAGFRDEAEIPFGEPLTFDHVYVVRGDVEVHPVPFVGRPPLTASAPLPPAWGAPAADEVIDIDELVKRLRTKTDPVRRAVIETTMKKSLNGAGIDFDVTNPLTAKVLAQSASQVTNIAETTRLNVMKTIKASYDEGLTIPDTATAIRAGMRAASPARARLIARTELAGAVNGGSLAATQIVSDATGLQYDKEWMTAPGAPNPRHELVDGLDGQTVPLDGMFDVEGEQLEFPGDPNGSPENVCNCFPGSVEVDGPRALIGFRYRYDGDLVRVVTDGGHDLSGTPNHPVLTDTGWKALALLDEGDRLICGVYGDGPRPGGPHVQDMPALIEEVFGSLSEDGTSRRVAGSRVDFHGDVPVGEVEVVGVDSLLRYALPSTVDHPLEEGVLARADLDKRLLAGARSGLDSRGPVSTFAQGGVRGGRDPLALLERGGSHARIHGGGTVTRLDAHLSETDTDDASAHAVQLGESLLGDAFEVAVAKVVKVERQSFHGYVFTLQTETGAFLADGIIAANCRCTMSYVEPGGQVVEAGDAESGILAPEDVAAAEGGDIGGLGGIGGEGLVPVDALPPMPEPIDLGGGIHVAPVDYTALPSEYAPEITGEQTAALKAYADNAYEDINKALRGGTLDKATDYIKNWVSLLDGAFRSRQAQFFDKGVTVHRAIHSDASKIFGTDDPSTLIGKTVKDDGFMSGSLKPFDMEEWVTRDSAAVTIDVPKGFPAISMDSIGGTGIAEEEVVLPRGTTMRITDARRDEFGVWEVKAVVVPDVERAIEETGEALTDGPATEMLDSLQARWGETLTSDETAALKDWKREVGYKEINNYLRLGEKVPGIEDRVAVLDRVIARAPEIPQDVATVAYRGVYDLRGTLGDDVRVGKVIEEKGFVSVSTEYDVAYDYAQNKGGGIIKVELPAGSRGAWMRSAGLEKTSSFYDTAENREMLLARGQRFVVTKVERDELGMPVVTVTPQKVEVGAAQNAISVVPTHEVEALLDEVMEGGWPEEAEDVAGSLITSAAEDADQLVRVLRDSEGNLGAVASTVESADRANVLVLDLASRGGKGEGTALLREIAGKASEKGKGVTLAATNEAAPYYEKLGMRMVSNQGESMRVFEFSPEEARVFAEDGKAEVGVAKQEEQVVQSLASERVDAQEAERALSKIDVAEAERVQENTLWDPESGTRIPEALNHANAQMEIVNALDHAVKPGYLVNPETHVIYGADRAPSAAISFTVKPDAVYVEHLGSTVKGGGTALLKVAAQRAVETGADHMHFQAVEEQIGFYERLGFRVLNDETHEMAMDGEALRKFAGVAAKKETVVERKVVEETSRHVVVEKEPVKKSGEEEWKGPKLSDDVYVASLQRELYSTNNVINYMNRKVKAGTATVEDRHRLEALRKRKEDVRALIAAPDPKGELSRVRNQINYMKRKVRDGSATHETHVRLGILEARAKELAALGKGAAGKIVKDTRAELKRINDESDAALGKAEAKRVQDARAREAEQAKGAVNYSSPTGVASLLIDQPIGTVVELPAHDIFMGTDTYKAGRSFAWMDKSGVVVKREASDVYDTATGLAQKDAEKIAADYLQSVPESMQGELQMVTLSNGYSPSDAYFQKAYKGFRHAAAQGGDGQMWFWQGYKTTFRRPSFDHELGHVVGYGSGPRDTIEWSQAQTADQKASAKISTVGLHNAYRPVLVGQRAVTEYGSNNNMEDWAESVRLWLESRREGRFSSITDYATGQVRDLTFADVFPARARILDREFGP